ncbi:MAG: hypothetical protein RBT47_05540 [Anaerolineae bacterium]|jgi:hypothetical protein|nr:hypothetical protein [Anaerolineae bacterium]
MREKIVMVEPEPTLDEWRSLYQAAMHFKEVAPWEWMNEDEVFGIKDPETGELGFASIMGALGEHLSLAIYRGAAGLYTFWVYHDMGEDAPPEGIMDIPHLQAAFGNRESLDDLDRDVIKELGLKFRGRQAWPWFRSFRPGFVPWYLEGTEARFLTHALEQAEDVALRFRENPALLIFTDDDTYLIRVPHKQGKTLVWQDEVQTISPPQPEQISLFMDLEKLEKVKRLPKAKVTLEVDLIPLSFPVADEWDPRPYFPSMLLVVDGSSGMILGTQLLRPDPTVLELFGNVPFTLVQQFASLGCIPARVKVQNDLMLGLTRKLADELNFSLKKTAKLRFLNQVRDFLLGNTILQE